MVGTDEPPTFPPEPPGGKLQSDCTPPYCNDDYSLLQGVLCLTLLMEVALCVYLTSQSSIALCCVTTVTSSPPLPSIPTTAARTPGSNGRTSLVQPTKTFLNVQVDAYTTSNLPIMFCILALPNCL